MAKEIQEIKIRYKKKLAHKGDIDGKPYKEFEYDFIKASLSCTKRYNTALCLLMGINGCPHHLIDWISDNVTNGGYVSNNDITRKAFIAFHKRYKKAGNKEYSEHAVIKAFKQLSDEGFLIPLTKGTYQINPLMYFSNSESERIKSIKYMMEFKSGIETKMTVEVSK